MKKVDDFFDEKQHLNVATSKLKSSPERHNEDFTQLTRKTRETSVGLM